MAALQAPPPILCAAAISRVRAEQGLGPRPVAPAVRTLAKPRKRTRTAQASSFASSPQRVPFLPPGVSDLKQDFHIQIYKDIAGGWGWGLHMWLILLGPGAAAEYAGGWWWAVWAHPWWQRPRGWRLLCRFLCLLGRAEGGVGFHRTCTQALGSLHLDPRANQGLLLAASSWKVPRPTASLPSPGRKPSVFLFLVQSVPSASFDKQLLGSDPAHASPCHGQLGSPSRASRSKEWKCSVMPSGQTW